ncbi:MAG: metallophosphoesterase, partial [Sulfitobacter sp.]|nr:metallophosphoesterase [Sulfitobacter sp.]
GPVELGGEHLSELKLGALSFRHIATPGAQGEISGHYHPKATLSLKGRNISRPAFVYDTARLILPAYGTYTGGLRTSSDPIRSLMSSLACAILTGAHPTAVPMPR